MNLPKNYSLELKINPSEKEKNIIDEGLDNYNQKYIKEYSFKHFTLLIKNREKELLAGIHISIYWDWLVIENLWLIDLIKTDSVMNILFEEIENIGRKENIYNIETNTVYSKYCDLFERNGYIKFGVVEQNPNPFTRSYFKKNYNKKMCTTQIPNEYELVKSPGKSDLSLYQNKVKKELDSLPANDKYTICILLKKEETIVGGLISEIADNWLFIDQAWVPEAFRGKGIGSEMIKLIEEKSKEYGTVGSNLCTSSFQALDFYKSHSYTIFGSLDDYPKGHIEYYLKKKFE